MSRSGDPATAAVDPVRDGEMGPPATASERRFGEPIELPWWVIPLGLPPLVTLVLGILVSAPLSGRLLVLAASAGLLWVLGRVSTRVRSTSMQSVWISAAYPFWLVVVLLWAVEVHG